MRILLFISFIILLSMTSCHADLNQKPEVFKYEILGRWMMQKVVIQEKDIDQVPAFGKRLWFNFSEDGQFQSGGGISGISQGKWALDEKTSILHMVTTNHEESDWEISLKKNEMEWKGLGNSGQQDFKLILERKDWTKS